MNFNTVLNYWLITNCRLLGWMVVEHIKYMHKSIQNIGQTERDSLSKSERERERDRERLPEIVSSVSLIWSPSVEM